MCPGLLSRAHAFDLNCRHTRDYAAAHAKYLASRCAKLPFLSLLGKGLGHVDIDLRGWGLPLAPTDSCFRGFVIFVSQVGTCERLQFDFQWIPSQSMTMPEGRSF